MKHSTFNGYQSKVRNHAIPYIGSLRLAKVDAGALNGLYAQMLASGRRRSSRAGRGYSGEVVERALALRSDGLTLQATADALQFEFEEASHITKDTLASLLRRQSAVDVEPAAGLDPSTVRAFNVVLHKAFKAAVKWKRLPRNPVDDADPPAMSTHPDEVETWTSSKLRSFLAATADDRLHGLWVLLATTGMRRGEAVGLRWKDVDLDLGRLRVVHTMPPAGGPHNPVDQRQDPGERPEDSDGPSSDRT